MQSLVRDGQGRYRSQVNSMEPALSEAVATLMSSCHYRNIL